MSQPNRFRAASLIVNGQKAGYFESTDEDYKTGDEAQFGDPGYVGHSDGAGMIRLTATAVHPIGGMEIPDLYQLAQAKAYIDIGLAPINGKVHVVTCRVISAKTTSHHKNGSQVGQYEFEGGEPTIASV